MNDCGPWPTQTAIRNMQLKRKILFACTVQSNTSLACSGYLTNATKNEEVEQKILGSTVLSWQFYRTVLTNLNSILKNVKASTLHKEQSHIQWFFAIVITFDAVNTCQIFSHLPNRKLLSSVLQKKNMATCKWVASNTTLLPIAMYCRRKQCRIAVVWKATIKDALFLESNDDLCCSLQAAFRCHLPKRRTLPLYNNTNSLNAFKVLELKCPILKHAFQASFILVSLLYAHYNVLFEVLRNCLSLRQNIKRKYHNDMLQYNRNPAVLFAWI